MLWLLVWLQHAQPGVLFLAHLTLPHLEAPPPCQGCFPCDSSHGLGLFCQLSCPLLLLSLSLCHLQGKMLD